MRKKTLPKDAVDQWPEVLSGITVSNIPLQYIDSIRIIFLDGKIWDFNVAKQSKKIPASELESNIAELIHSYENSIQDINYSLNVSLLKKEITKQTSKFLKENNKP